MQKEMEPNALLYYDLAQDATLASKLSSKARFEARLNILFHKRYLPRLPWISMHMRSASAWFCLSFSIESILLSLFIRFSHQLTELG